MPDPFATALGALLVAPGSVAAVYTPRGSSPISLRALRGQGDEVVRTQHGGVITGGNAVTLPRSVPDPAGGTDIVLVPRKGDLIELGTDGLFTLIADGTLDPEGISWSVRTD